MTLFAFVNQIYAQAPEIYNPALPVEYGAGSGGVALAMLIANVWRAIIVLGGIALILYLVWGGIEWVMAGGDSGKVESARAKMTQSTIGMAILAATVAITIFLSSVLKIDLLNPVFFGPGDAPANRTPPDTGRGNLVAPTFPPFNGSGRATPQPQ